MINSLYKTLEIDTVYSVNSFIYHLRQLPIFKDLFTDDIYSSKVLKRIVGIFGILLSLLRVIGFKILYFYMIYFVSKTFFPDNILNTFIHLYFSLTIIGMFINNRLLNTSKKKYFSLILFNMDGESFLRASLLWNFVHSFIFNTICLFIFKEYIGYSVYEALSLSLLSCFVRVIGEGLNMLFYKNNNYIWYSNTTYYSIILLIGLGISLLPFINIFISFNLVNIFMYISIILSLFSFYYLFRVDDYKLIYKRLNQVVEVMDKKNEDAYFRQAMVSVKDKDKIINSKKIEGKKGFDLFNTIFFERHREILTRSAYKYSLVLIGIYIVIGYLILNNNQYNVAFKNVYSNHLSWFILIMYFINRGSIVTQAMFFNCDHAMLRYNFYRESNIIVGLFKKRLITIIKVNLIPAIVIGIGNSIMYFILGFNYISIITSFLFILFLSIFYSTHYLVIYYLLQPYNKNMEMKKISYYLVTVLTYIVAYILTRLMISSLVLSSFGLLITIIYIIGSLYLVYKYAPRSFHL